MICVGLCKVLQPIALKTKKLRRKVSQIKAQYSCINDGASLITHSCTINSVENGTRFSYDTRGENPEKIPYFCPGIHSYFYKDCGCTMSTCLLSLLNQSAKKLFFKLLTIIIMVLESQTREILLN